MFVIIYHKFGKVETNLNRKKNRYVYIIYEQIQFVAIRGFNK